jgi:fructooligosaccharide transport system substrate-binding protein
MRKTLAIAVAALLLCSGLTGCTKEVEPGDVAGFDEGEQYISMWVHTIEDTPEGQAYKESVEKFNEAYNGIYFADVEFIPRNDSGGGYSDKINASVMSEICLM